MLKRWCAALLRLCYNVDVHGIEHYHEAGQRVVIVANHLSFLDGLLLAAFLPGTPIFAINSQIAKRWYFKPFFLLVNTFPLDPTNPMATKAIIHKIRKNNVCVIFPEGRITVTGSLMKVYEGPGMIADKSDATIVPVRIDGAQYTPFSRLRGKVRIRWFPHITLTILPPRRFDIDNAIKGRKRRHLAGVKLYDLMSEMLFQSSDYKQTLYSSLLDQMHLHGRHHIIAEDARRHPISYGQLVTRSLALGHNIAQDTDEGQLVGLMLPTMVNSVIAFFALQAYGRVPAMLNFSTGEKNVLSACTTAEIRIVYSSKQFVAKAKLEPLIEAIEAADVTVCYLEDCVQSISVRAKLMAWASSFMARTVISRAQQRTDEDSAVVLFTSGSEGTPKGVVLSHRNIQANRYQLASRIDFGPDDIVFNALPIFHSFGLTAATLLPVLSGIRTFFYPSPLHYRIVPELVYDTNATIMFGTDTFLSGYARFANPYDFYSIRYVFAGAERLKDETRDLWAQRYGVRILEGYGATETSPVLSTNTPMHNRPNTVGRFMPGITYRLMPVEGINDGGRLIVTGLNVMKGYLLNDNPGIITPPPLGQYDTGDIVALDEEGYVTIKGRAKRFAKVGGEMVSLTAVEAYLSALWPEHSHAVAAIADEKKGEALVLLTTRVDPQRRDITNYTKAHGISELSVPRIIDTIDEIPLLGTGKVDYVTLQAIANKHAVS